MLSQESSLEGECRDESWPVATYKKMNLMLQMYLQAKKLVATECGHVYCEQLYETKF